MSESTDLGPYDYQGRCPIPGCEFVFAQGHNGIDAHVRSNQHAKDFSGVSAHDRYGVFLDRYPKATWPRLEGKPTQLTSTLPLAAPVDEAIKAEMFYSTYREKLIEHIFISELLQEAWIGRQMMIDVLRSEIDASGYDLVLECEGVVRHVQLKSSRWNSKTDWHDINAKLAKKPAGCVIWILVREDELTRRINLSYRYFGGAPNEPLLLSEELHKPARHVKANAQGVKTIRPGIRTVTKRFFKPVEGGISELLTLLFGESTGSVK